MKHKCHILDNFTEQGRNEFQTKSLLSLVLINFLNAFLWYVKELGWPLQYRHTQMYVRDRQTDRQTRARMHAHACMPMFSDTHMLCACILIQHLLTGGPWYAWLHAMRKWKLYSQLNIFQQISVSSRCYSLKFRIRDTVSRMSISWYQTCANLSGTTTEIFART